MNNSIERNTLLYWQKNNINPTNIEGKELNMLGPCLFGIPGSESSPEKGNNFPLDYKIGGKTFLVFFDSYGFPQKISLH